MTVRELYDALSDRIPASLSCDWDHDGMSFCPEEDREIYSVLVALDADKAAIRYAEAGAFDLIVTHHPLLFHGVHEITQGSVPTARLIAAMTADVPILSFHTRLDKAEGGVNDLLAELLGLSHVNPLGEDGLGRIGILPEPMNADDFCDYVKEALGADAVRFADSGKLIRAVAVVGGAGGRDGAKEAREAGADAYLTGEVPHDVLSEYPELGLSVIEAGHYETEAPICARLAEWIRETSSGLRVEVYDKNPAVIR